MSAYNKLAHHIARKPAIKGGFPLMPGSALGGLTRQVRKPLTPAQKAAGYRHAEDNSIVRPGYYGKRR